MSEYRCPKHDALFTSLTDHRPPGSPAKGSFAAHPNNGHPDCSLCQEEAQKKSAPPLRTQGETTTKQQFRTLVRG